MLIIIVGIIIGLLKIATAYGMFQVFYALMRLLIKAMLLVCKIMIGTMVGVLFGELLYECTNVNRVAKRAAARYSDDNN